MLLNADPSESVERRALELLASARQTAGQLGMRGLLERTQRVARSGHASPVRPAA
jgi:hypothetical protein